MRAYGQGTKIGRPPTPVGTRFWAKVVRTDGCWFWIAAKGTDGHGIFCVSSQRQTTAHRFSFEMHFGPLPKGWHVHHVCENKACVRPDHLEALTASEHSRHHKPRATHCWRCSIELTIENTLSTGPGQYRRCKPCHNALRREYRRRNPGAMNGRISDAR